MSSKSIWSRLRSLLGRPAPVGDEPTDEAPPNDADADAQEQSTTLFGTIDDYDPLTSTGVITLEDEAVLGFGSEACQGFVPIIGLRVAALSVGVPPASSQEGYGQEDGIGLWATRLQLRPGTETEYAARLRIGQVERAMRMAGHSDRLIPVAADRPVVTVEPPWARGKNRAGRMPSGPQRPQDAFFVLTLILGSELTAEPTALATMLSSRLFGRPNVRVIQLVRNQVSEPGFSIEVRAQRADNRRAFLLYRPEPYGEFGGRAHIGLFVGGPHSPRVAAQLGEKAPQAAVGPDSEAALLSALARCLLRSQPDSLGLVLNRAGKVWKPRETALSQLGDDEPNQVPFVFFIDWNAAERNGRLCLLSSGMESLGLPDVAVVLTEDSDAARDRGRDVLLHACQKLVQNTLRDQAGSDSTLLVPRHLQLRAGSRLEIEERPGSPIETEPYRITTSGDGWIELGPSA